MQAKEKEQQKKSEIIDESSNSELLDSTSDSTI